MQKRGELLDPQPEEVLPNRPNADGEQKMGVFRECWKRNANDERTRTKDS